MTISEETRKALYKRAGGRCECTMRVCSHHPPGQMCPRKLADGYWEAHRRTAGGPYTLSNLIAMCATCHKNTRTYGKI
jgi:hypothetical protein